MLKEQLIAEAQKIDASVALDSIFESVNISPEAKETFGTVFEATVKQHAVKLAESHIAKIAEKAEEEVEKNKEEAEEKAEKKIAEQASKFLDHLAKEWLTENKLAVDKGIKAELFESMLGGLKELFVEHNVVVPEESVDVVAEMEEELQEHKEESARLFEELNKRDAYINYVQREVALSESTKDLTESQKEKVSALVEGIDYSDAFSSKLSAIVEMVKKSNKDESTITESINTPDTEEAGLNFVTEAVEDKSAQGAEDIVSVYAKVASRF
uniref:Capsid assembly scaffolding protein n=2 Tax=Tequatrovirus TaxID=10663 RepID=SCAF_BPAR1|nr:RecName: Full=Capsid assembly scaffolding protein; AltName: Full=Gene product 22; Short=gp22; AltName: Full=Head morphogenesis protein; AltName: Full=Major prohead-scaffolding core protein Gp22; AltName: Full=Scaffold protein; Contains: RecName: Full=Internal peptide VII [Escherichia phage AR1]AAD01754.1 putative prohead core [Escherichia phage AR1]